MELKTLDALGYKDQKVPNTFVVQSKSTGHLGIILPGYRHSARRVDLLGRVTGIPHSTENCAFLDSGKRNFQPWVLYNMAMNRALSSQIPIGLKPYFQEYDIARLNLERDANLIIQRTLEFGTWEELRWLFETYRSKRIRLFLREYGVRQLKPVTFNYWQKLLNIRRWKKSPFKVERGELWDH